MCSDDGGDDGGGDSCFGANDMSVCEPVSKATASK